jgi:hypothetical protein
MIRSQNERFPAKMGTYKLYSFHAGIRDPGSPYQRARRAGAVVLRAPGSRNLDVSLFKDIRVGERRHLDFVRKHCPMPAVRSSPWATLCLANCPARKPWDVRSNSASNSCGSAALQFANGRDAAGGGIASSSLAEASSIQ